MYLFIYLFLFFFFNDTATTEIYTLSLHDALPISRSSRPTGSSNTKRSRSADESTSRSRTRAIAGKRSRARSANASANGVGLIAGGGIRPAPARTRRSPRREDSARRGAPPDRRRGSVPARGSPRSGWDRRCRARRGTRDGGRGTRALVAWAADRTHRGCPRRLAACGR